MFEYLLAQLLNGISVGVIYALIAVGLTIVFSILKIVNFAHGEFYMIGGYFSYFAITLAGATPLLGIPLAMLGSALLAVLFERTMLTPLFNPATERKGDYGVLVTFGLSILLRNLAIITFGPFPLRPPSVWHGVLQWEGIVVTHDRLVAVMIGILMFAALMYFLHRTAWGQALSAVSQSRDSAAIVGINARLVYTMAFGLGGALAGGAGALVAPIYSLSPSMGLQPDIQAFAVVVLGGMGSVAGSLIAGLLIGISESLFTAFFPDPTLGLAYASAFSLLLMMIVLLVRPNGILGRTHTAME